MLGCNVSKDQRADSDGGDILNDGFVGEYVIRHVFFQIFAHSPLLHRVTHYFHLVSLRVYIIYTLRPSMYSYFWLIAIGK